MNLKSVVITSAILTLVLSGMSVIIQAVWHPDNNATYLGYIIVLCTMVVVLSIMIRTE